MFDFNNLLDELKFQIFSYLSLSDKFNSLRVSKNWHTLLNKQIDNDLQEPEKLYQFFKELVTKANIDKFNYYSHLTAFKAFIKSLPFKPKILFTHILQKDIKNEFANILVTLLHFFSALEEIDSIVTFLKQVNHEYAISLLDDGLLLAIDLYHLAAKHTNDEKITFTQVLETLLLAGANVKIALKHAQAINNKIATNCISDFITSYNILIYHISDDEISSANASENEDENDSSSESDPKSDINYNNMGSTDSNSNDSSSDSEPTRPPKYRRT